MILTFALLSHNCFAELVPTDVFECLWGVGGGQGVVFKHISGIGVGRWLFGTFQVLVWFWWLLGMLIWFDVDR